MRMRARECSLWSSLTHTSVAAKDGYGQEAISAGLGVSERVPQYGGDGSGMLIIAS